ncbi:MAG: phage portal protein, partial [Pirellulales bacterium]|nr:phage portal protein [Pirellulales bacterium]
MIRAPHAAGPRLSTSDIFGMHDTLRCDYDGARSSRFRRQRAGVSGSGRTADYHYRNEGDYLRLMEYARDFDRNEPVIGQLLDRAADNIVQDGFAFDPCSGDRPYDQAIKQLWTEWAEDPDSCDESGEHDFAERQWLDMRQTLVDGDVIELAMDTGALSGVEAHRCRTPTGTTQKNVIHGVKLGERRKRLQYWLTNDDIGPLTPLKLVRDITPYDVRGPHGRQVFHVYRPNRYSQTRGVTSLAPVFDFIGIGGDLVFANLVRHLIANCVVFLRSKGADFSEAADAPATGETSQQELADGTTRLLQGIAPGMELEARKGETIQGFTPGMGDPQFEPLLMYVLAVIGANLGLPLIMVLMDSSKTNFSGWRGAFDQAKLGFRRRQKMLIKRLLRPAYYWKLEHFWSDSAALRRMAERLGPAARWHKFHPPSWPYIEPLKDATADLLQQANGQNSARRIQAEKGIDIEDLQDEIIEDNASGIAKAIARAEVLNQNLPPGSQPIHWRELLPMPAADGVKVSLAVDAAGDGGESDKPK